MEEQKMDLKETKEMLSFVLGIFNAVGKSLEDGKVDVSDIALLLGPLMKVGSAVQGAARIPSELKDLSQEESNELKEFISKEFDIPQDHLEKVLEQSLFIVVKVYQLFMEIVDLRKKR